MKQKRTAMPFIMIAYCWWIFFIHVPPWLLGDVLSKMSCWINNKAFLSTKQLSHIIELRGTYWHSHPCPSPLLPCSAYTTTRMNTKTPCWLLLNLSLLKGTDSNLKGKKLIMRLCMLTIIPNTCIC